MIFCLLIKTQLEKKDDERKEKNLIKMLIPIEGGIAKRSPDVWQHWKKNFFTRCTTTLRIDIDMNKNNGSSEKWTSANLNMQFRVCEAILSRSKVKSSLNWVLRESLFIFDRFFCQVSNLHIWVGESHFKIRSDGSAWQIGQILMECMRCLHLTGL